MGYRYITVEDTFSDEQDTRIGYGIALVSGKADGASVLREIPDLSGDRKLVDQLARACNKYKLDPIHLDDIVYDFLASI